MDALLKYMDLILKFANIAIICYGLYKFLGKPHSSLEQRVAQNEKDIAEMKGSLKQGNRRFSLLAKGLEIIMRSVVALIEFEANYCMTEHKEFSDELKESKKELNSYLSSISRGFDE